MKSFTSFIAVSLIATLCSTVEAQRFKRTRPKRCVNVCHPCPLPSCSTTSFTCAHTKFIPNAMNPRYYSLPFTDASFTAYSDPGNYGRWCGAYNTSDPSVPPIDGVDAVCKAHDLCLLDRGGHHCSCDAAFIRDMASASASSAEGEVYRVAAIAAFANKPCFCTYNYPCNCQLFPPRCDTCEGRYPGVAGQCGPRP